MNNSQKLLSLVALYLMAEGAHMTADRDVYTGQTNPTPKCPDSHLADEMLKEEWQPDGCITEYSANIYQIKAS